MTDGVWQTVTNYSSSAKTNETLHAQLHVNPTQPLGEYNEFNF